MLGQLNPISALISAVGAIAISAIKAKTSRTQARRQSRHILRLTQMQVEHEEGIAARWTSFAAGTLPLAVGVIVLIGASLVLVRR